MKFVVALFFIVSADLLVASSKLSDEPSFSTDAKMADIGILMDRLDRLEVKLDQYELQIRNQQIEIEQLKKNNLKLNAEENGNNKKITLPTILEPTTRSAKKRVKPSNCMELYSMGHNLNGFYNVQNETSKKIVLMYCDFNILMFSSTGYETQYGTVDVKSSPVHFFVTRNTTLSVPLNGPITFNVEKLNVGGGMNSASGVFTAPKAGIYEFTFKGTAIGEFSYSGTTTTGHSLVFLALNGQIVSSGFSRVNDATTGFLPVSLHAILKLSAGDQVMVFPFLGDLFGANVFSTGYTQFMGSLVEEDLILP